MRLKDDIAIVTGGGQGIGAEIARNFSEEGASVVIADVDQARATSVANTLAAGVGIRADVSEPSDTEALVEAALDMYGKLDILVNNAAVTPFTPWEEVDYESWRSVMSVNLDGVFHMCRAAYKPMRTAGYGRIVNMASNVVIAGTPNFAQYVASKGGVVAFTRALATELGGFGITVNCVAPGLTETEGTLGSPHSAAFDEVESMQAIRRRGYPKDIAPVVTFLASEESRWMTGSLVVVDGGHTRH